MNTASKLTSATLATFCAVTVGLALSSAPALAAYTKVSRFAAESSPWGAAVDQVTGEVFVAADEHKQVQRFIPTNRANPSEGYTLGSPLNRTFTTALTVAVGGSGDVYVPDAGTKEIYEFEASSGTEIGSFGTGATPIPLAEPIGVAVDPANDDVYVSDGPNSTIDVYDASGAFVKQFGVGGVESRPGQLAFNSSGSDLYVVAGGKVEEVDASGNPVNQSAGPHQGTNIVDNSGHPSAVAVDPATNEVFVDQAFSETVAIFAASGAESSSFSAAFSEGLAVDESSDVVLVTELGEEAVSVYQSLVFPEVRTGSATGVTETTATLEGTVNPEGQPVTSCMFEYGTSTSYGHSESCEQTLAEINSGSGTEPAPVSAAVTGLQLNTVYHYRLVVGNKSATGRGEDGVFKTTAVAPAVNDQPPSVSSITGTTARLSGTINPENSPTNYRFEYGTTTAYGLSTKEATAGSGYGDASVGRQALAELQPETTYHFRLVATNEAVGTTTGPDYTFTTAPPTPPLVSTGGTSGLTQTSATVSGVLDPQGIETSYAFEVGTDTTYSGAKAFGDAGNGEGAEPIAVALEDLAPGTTYHFRLTATNADGSSYGQDMTFTTPGIPSPIGQPLTMPLLATPSIAFPKEEKAATTKTLTNAQKLAAALKACKKEPKKRQAACERQARKHYSPKPKAKKVPKRGK